jgi:hypothetical protein
MINNESMAGKRRRNLRYFLATNLGIVALMANSAYFRPQHDFVAFVGMLIAVVASVVVTVMLVQSYRAPKSVES